MASHFKWYPSESEVVVPFNARYSFPSQANKTVKMTPRIPPKTGDSFVPGSIIRLEFPAQGYVNPANTTLEFDVVLGDFLGSNSASRFQNNIQSIFSRVRLLYGATPIEDIINYNQIVRCLTEWTGTTQIGTLDQTSVADGIGGVVIGTQGTNTGSVLPKRGLVNIRQAYIQGNDGIVNTAVSAAVSGGAITSDLLLSATNYGTGFANVPNLVSGSAGTQQRYQVSLALGLFQQEKLIPTKFMASQLAIELTLEQGAACLLGIYNHGTVTNPNPSYTVKNVNLIPEILEFDASYGIVV